MKSESDYRSQCQRDARMRIEDTTLPTKIIGQYGVLDSIALVVKNVIGMEFAGVH